MSDSTNRTDLERFRLPGDYWLMIPSWHDLDDHQIVVYDIVEMLQLQHTGRTLEGHPSKDLRPEAWGTIRFSARKAARWVEKGRLLKIRLKEYIKPVVGNGEVLTLSVRYSEPEEWQSILTLDEWQWIASVCQVSELYKQQIEAESENQQIEFEPTKPKIKSKRRQKLEKQRRREHRNRLRELNDA